MSEKKFRYSEIFGHTFQGEGHYTGVPTVWYRSWGCNFNCSGFGQDNPEDPATWVLDYQDIDPTQYKTMEELPVFSRGCDSSYSWAKKFAHLARQNTPSEITTLVRSYLKHETNPDGLFRHPKSGQWTHMAFTGGEPMMSQTAILAIMNQFMAEGDLPRYVTIETNGTQAPRQEFVDFFSATPAKAVDNFKNEYVKVEGASLYTSRHSELFFSISPKLYLSGERWDQAIRPDVVKSYHDISRAGQLKYVSNGTQKSWDEIERATALYRDAGVDYPVWIMPVGADIEGQNKVAARVAEEAVKRGYNVSARVHTYVFGNMIGK